MTTTFGSFGLTRRPRSRRRPRPGRRPDPAPVKLADLAAMSATAMSRCESPLFGISTAYPHPGRVVTFGVPGYGSKL